LLFRNLKFAEQSLSLLFQKLGFPEHQTFGRNIDEDEAQVLLLTSCYQEVAERGGGMREMMQHRK
jgi:hypothetical protein